MMNTVRARLAALLAGLLLARLAGSGLVEASPELALALERWVERSLELAVTLGYALLERWVRGRALRTDAPGDPRLPRGRPRLPGRRDRPERCSFPHPLHRAPARAPAPPAPSARPRVRGPGVAGPAEGSLSCGVSPRGARVPRPGSLPRGRGYGRGGIGCTRTSRGRR